jgi:hypothetical protein
MGKGLEKIVGHQTVVGDQFEHLFVISLLWYVKHQTIDRKIFAWPLNFFSYKVPLHKAKKGSVVRIITSGDQWMEESNNWKARVLFWRTFHFPPRVSRRKKTTIWGAKKASCDLMKQNLSKLYPERERERESEWCHASCEAIPAQLWSKDCTRKMSGHDQ